MRRTARLKASGSRMDFRGAILRTEMAFALILSVAATDVVALDVPTPPRRPASSRKEPIPEAKPPSNGQPLQAATEPREDCMAKLREAGVEFEPAQAPSGDLDGCAIDAPVRLAAVTVDKRRVALNGKPMLSCAFALEVFRFRKKSARAARHRDSRCVARRDQFRSGLSMPRAQSKCRGKAQRPRQGPRARRRRICYLRRTKNCGRRSA